MAVEELRLTNLHQGSGFPPLLSPSWVFLIVSIVSQTVKQRWICYMGRAGRDDLPAPPTAWEIPYTPSNTRSYNSGPRYVGRSLQKLQFACPVNMCVWI